MTEAFCRLAEAIRGRYQAVAHSGVRGGPGTGQVNAVRAEVYREVLALLLAEILQRPPTRDEIAAWIAGQAGLPEPVAAPAPQTVAPDPIAPEAITPEPVGALLASAVQ